MSKKVQIDQSEFDALLNWLSPNREEAGERYESIRSGLIRYFRFKGCSNEEDLADETINRVTKKLPKLDLTTGNKPITYFYGFASKIFLEELKRNRKETEFETRFQPANPNDLIDVEENRFNCLEKCLNKIKSSEKELLTNYYRKDKSEKFDFRKRMAESLGISINTLHVKIHRLRNTVRICLEKCLREDLCK
jgi:RNA polymerase sigma factor (sigma-70 family)